MRETRILSDSQLCVRSEENGGNIVEGYASIFNHESRLIAENGKVFYEIIHEGAFDNALLREDLNVIANRDHDDKQMLARTLSGTLALQVDSTGLKYTFPAPQTTLGKDTVELLERGDLRESSFRFSVKPSGVVWEYGSDGILRRNIKEIFKVLDVAIVINGAFSNTDVSVRGINTEKVEEHLRELTEHEHQLNAYFTNLEMGFE
jgi:hypothetical protein